MKTIKVIDLLNKIANGEEIPKYIKYYDILHQKEDTMMCCYNNIIYKLDNNIIDLLDEVEIIEEKKIPEKLNIEDDGNTITLFGEKENEWTILDNVDVIVCNKINSIIDYLKSKGE